MKNICISLLTLLTFSSNVYSQTFSILQYNNTKAFVNTNGVFLNDLSNNNSGYTVPKNQTYSSIYASSFWFGGLDGSNDLYLSATKYGQNQDIFSGPVATNYNDANYIGKYVDKIWNVSINDINSHIQNYNSTGYTVPSNIADWPAHGNTVNGESEFLAPFVDLNNNNIYDPENGDYPNIRGDYASFMIFNDTAGTHTESGGNALGMEFHFMFYQYATTDNIDNTTFINLKVINRSSRTYSNFKVGQFTDADLGNYNDDYFGSNPQENLIYTYNGDNNDEGQFGISPPAIGFKALNHLMDVASYTSSSSTGNQSFPSNASDYWGVMNGEWNSSGIHFTEGGNGLGGTINTNYLMSTNPNDASGWSEQTELNAPGDRRMFMVSEGKTIAPNQYICYDYAVVYARGSSNLNSVDSLFSVANEVQQFYDSNSLYTCENVVLGLELNATLQEIVVYPNPNNGQFTIKGLKNSSQVLIYSIDGKLLEKIDNTQSSLLNIDLSKYKKGNYFVKIVQNGAVSIKKIVIE